MLKSNTTSASTRRVATVGTFDGVHRGHRRVLQMVKRLASERNLEPLVVSFDRHPLQTIAPERVPGLIQSPSRRANILYKEGFQLLTLEFTPALARHTAESWLELMHRQHGVDALVVGYDNTFGSDGTAMELADYKAIGARVGVEVIEAPVEPHVSSSAIRKAVAAGDVEAASRMLGYPFSITGEVRPGKQMGSSLGFPTANVWPAYRAQFPANGVYCVDVEMPDGSLRRGVANIGRQPTVANNAPVALEVHIPGIEGDLYGETLDVRFLRRLRDEIKFDSPQALARQIALDVEEALQEGEN